MTSESLATKLLSNKIILNKSQFEKGKHDRFFSLLPYTRSDFIMKNTKVQLANAI